MGCLGDRALERTNYRIWVLVRGFEGMSKEAGALSELGAVRKWGLLYHWLSQ